MFLFNVFKHSANVSALVTVLYVRFQILMFGFGNVTF